MNLKIANEIIEWIKNYAIKHDMKTLVVGVSGGIDSAVVSTLCASTGIETIVLNLPIASKKENTDLSTFHCNWLKDNFSNIRKYCISLDDPYKSFEQTLRLYNFSNTLSNANSKSRLRMMVLYYIAGCTNGIVVGTGNKVEDFGVGFFTKYGDGGVDISPIADLTKTQVRELGKYLRVSEEIINATPTDGLWEDSRSDEEQIGASYEELEWAMKDDVDPQTDREKEVIKIYNSFHEKNKHKMMAIPVFKVKQ